MVQQGKSYRHGKCVAPYRKPIAASSASKASSFFKRMKSLFDQPNNVNSANSNHSGSDGRSDRHSQPDTVIPGGFFTADVSSNSVNSTIRNDTSHREPTDFRRSRIAEYDDSNADSCAADTSNARLAEFFSNKGDMPLTDIEMEGVLSLMKKAKRSSSVHNPSTASSTIGDESIDLRASRVLKRSRTPSIATSSFKAPSFIPRYDNSMNSHTLGNTSLRSTSSRRRVFDYSNFSMPYKTVVYKYSAADSRDGSRVSSTSSAYGTQTKSFGASAIQAQNLSPPKKLSNTASALVSLLDNEPAKEGKTAQFSNPYSSLVNPIRDYRKNLKALPKDSPAATAQGSKPEVTVEMPDSKESSSSEILPKQRQKNQQKSSLDRYKPTRSSSLRSSMVTVENPAKDCKTEKEEEEEPHVPSAARFTFTVNHGEGDAEAAKRASIKQQGAFKFSSGDSSAESVTAAPEAKDDQIAPNNIFAQAGNGETTAKESLEQRKKKDALHDNSSAISHSMNNRVLSKSEEFKFEEPLPSGVPTNSLDEGKVGEFRSMFIF